MDLKTEEIIKILLILGVLYLLFNCVLTENFAEDPIYDSEKKDGNLSITADGKTYLIVSLKQLKDEYKKIFLDNFKKIDDEFITKNAEKKLSYLSNEPALKENNLSNEIIKIPLIIILEDDFDKYATEKFKVSFKNNYEKSIIPVGSPEQVVLHFSEDYKILFASDYENRVTKDVGKEITGRTSGTKVFMEPIKIGEKDVNTLKEEKLGTFTHYTLSSDLGKDIKWKLS